LPAREVVVTEEIAAIVPASVVRGTVKSFRDVENHQLYDAALHRWIDLLDKAVVGLKRKQIYDLLVSHRPVLDRNIPALAEPITQRCACGANVLDHTRHQTDALFALMEVDTRGAG
jgi:hypothetical protein